MSDFCTIVMVDFRNTNKIVVLDVLLEMQLKVEIPNYEIIDQGTKEEMMYHLSEMKKSMIKSGFFDVEKDEFLFKNGTLCYTFKNQSEERIDLILCSNTVKSFIKTKF